MFRGKSAHTLDAKGRLSVPARFREVLKTTYEDSRFMVTNLPNCLAAYPMPVWQKIEEKFSDVLFGPPALLKLKRYLLGPAVECRLDAQGRILIPASLREEAGLEKEIILAGMQNYIEIWNRTKLDEERRQVEEDFEKYSGDVFGEFSITL
jgi:MraZ protein